jgi:hypothetical protein
MPREADAFIPVLRETYQLNRTEDNEVKLRLQLLRASKEMQQFKPLLQRKWQIYLEALEEPQRFQIGDLSYALDCAVHPMHLRVGNKGLVGKGAEIDGLSPWSKEMKYFLEERRKARL